MASEYGQTHIDTLDSDGRDSFSITDLSSEFGITAEVLPRWAKTVMETQTRLLSNNPRHLTEKDVLAIYEAAL